MFCIPVFITNYFYSHIILIYDKTTQNNQLQHKQQQLRNKINKINNLKNKKNQPLATLNKDKTILNTEKMTNIHNILMKEEKNRINI